MVIKTWIDFKVEADPAQLALAYTEERHPINDNDDDFNKWYLIVYIYFSLYDFI
jgi:hypothetical protein